MNDEDDIIADRLLALINSSPRTPTKEQIKAVLKPIDPWQKYVCPENGCYDLSFDYIVGALDFRSPIEATWVAFGLYHQDNAARIMLVDARVLAEATEDALHKTILSRSLVKRVSELLTPHPLPEPLQTALNCKVSKPPKKPFAFAERHARVMPLFYSGLVAAPGSWVGDEWRWRDWADPLVMELSLPSMPGAHSDLAGAAVTALLHLRELGCVKPAPAP